MCRQTVSCGQTDSTLVRQPVKQHLVSGSSVVVEHSPRDLKDEGLSSTSDARSSGLYNKKL